MRILEDVIAKTDGKQAKMLLGCLLYNKRHYEKAVETLMSHSFVPCEGGEHAIADQYLFAHLAIGRKELEKAQAYISESFSLNSENLPALSFKVQGFLE